MPNRPGRKLKELGFALHVGALGLHVGALGLIIGTTGSSELQQE